MCDLRYRNDFKPAAIAQTMGMTANSVAKALQRIRTQLRNCMARKSTWRDATA
jgi:RNA polymerase sigma-70 factor (ECF subfamily)